MATSNSKPTQVLLPTFITFFLLLLNNANSSSDSLSFKFPKFASNQLNMYFQGDASVSTTGALQLTKVTKPDKMSIGRAQYATPVHIWDSITGRVANFETSFSFVVNASNANSTSDGLAFFLSPPDSQIPSGSLSRYLGLFNSSDYNSDNQIIAVEFDTDFDKTFDPWDPAYKHIGVNVNSIKSIKTVTWDWRNGEVAHVYISYRAATKSLTVSLSYPSDETSNIIAASVDLKAHLPEWVSIGFSAGYGSAEEFETHDVLSWYFTSTFDANNPSVIDSNVHVAPYYTA